MNIKTLALATVAAVGVHLGAAGDAAALTYGIIPSDSELNQGVGPIYGASTRGGYFGLDLALLAGPGGADVTFTFLGSEAGFNNGFWFNGIQIFQTGGNTSPGGVFNAAGIASTTVTGVTSGLLNFFFRSPNGDAVNGSNPDNTASTGVNFFTSFDNGESSLGGTSLVLWFDDDGNNDDDNHDDMAVRVSIRNGELGVVPVPAAGFLLLGGLGAMAAMRRRR